MRVQLSSRTCPENEFEKANCFGKRERVSRPIGLGTGNFCTYPEAGHVQGDVLVEAVSQFDCPPWQAGQHALALVLQRGSCARVQDELAQALVRPRAVHEQQLFEEPELADRDVGRPGSLETFMARDPDADVGSLDHRDVVRAVADREQDRFEVLLDELDDERLL